MSKSKRLGQGLAALLGAPLEEPVQATETASPPALQDEVTSETDASDASDESAGLLHLNVYDIDDNPFQPRRDFNESEIASLAESLRTHDMLQPILVRRLDDRYQLISGERRLRAAIQAGWSTVPARVREADDRLVAELAIIENLQRKDLNPIEKALSFRRYLDEHECTQEDLAKRLKIDRSTIANLMRLLELPEQLLGWIQDGSLSAGHARALLPLGDERSQVTFAEQIRSEGLSVRATERQVAEVLEKEDEDEWGVSKPKRKKRTRNEQLSSLEQELKMALGTKVEIKAGARGKGKIVIQFSNHDEFERIRNLLVDNGGIDLRRAS